ncbi:hypothetical protein [Paenibacillus qinlingensis]|uniref:Phage tail protein n=1 Tax=Paenibacillus qinlingensis TaxID=1837343 RepID=A0ABU1NNW8_9BACL|nr:hypothetical protein [Paenibacillus qinlingensis]MDR6549158.1 putative phage tail protein [Paenibacillus qinlingensis]
MNKFIKIVGIIFSLLTIAIGLSILLFESSGADTRLSWMMVALNASLIFNGGAQYLIKQDKKGLFSVVAGTIILLFILIKFPF